MDLTTDENETNIIIRLKGELSFKDHIDFNAFLKDLPHSSKSIVFDLSELIAIDSAGIGMLFLAQKVIEKSGGNMSLKNPTGQVKRVFDITKIGQSISIN